jgi:chromosome segregation ATPase
MKGPNTFVWDFRYAGATVIPDAVFQGQAVGPLAPPGTYRVELTVDGRAYTQSFKLLKDPRVPYSDAELEEQFQFMKRVSDRLEQTMSTVRRIRDMRKRAEDMVAQAKKSGKDAAELDQALKALNDKLYAIEERLVQFRARAGEDLINYPTGIDSKLARLLDFASMADAPPTEGEKELYGRLSEGVSDRIRLVDQVEKKEYESVVKVAGVAQ